MPVDLQTEHESYSHKGSIDWKLSISRVADGATLMMEDVYPAFTDVSGALGPNSHSLAGQELGVPETRAILVH